MKLVGITLLALLGSATVVAADTLHPPSGPVYVGDAALDDDDAPADMQRTHDPSAGPQRRYRDPAMQQQARARRGELRRLLIQELDVNGDGKLGPRERARGIRILRRLEMKLAGQGGGRRAQMKKFIERYDVDGDGNVGPAEVPAGAARKLRRFDRDRDGWVEPREVAPQQRRENL